MVPANSDAEHPQQHSYSKEFRLTERHLEQGLHILLGNSFLSTNYQKVPYFTAPEPASL